MCILFIYNHVQQLGLDLRLVMSPFLTFSSSPLFAILKIFLSLSFSFIFVLLRFLFQLQTTGCTLIARAISIGSIERHLILFTLSSTSLINLPFLLIRVIVFMSSTGWLVG